MWHGVVIVHSVAVETYRPHPPHRAAPPRTGSSPRPCCPSPRSSAEVFHHGRPNKEPEIPEVCLGSPAPPADSTDTISGQLIVAYRFLSHLHVLKTNLFGNSREFHHMERLVIGRRTLVDVDDHRRFSFAAENSLEELREFTLSERNVAVLHSEEERRKKQDLWKTTFQEGFSNAKTST